MTFESLSTALCRTYRLEGDLGQGGPERARGGGMATGYLAHVPMCDRHAQLPLVPPTPGGEP